MTTLTIPQPRPSRRDAPTGWDALDMPLEAGWAVLRRARAHRGPALAVNGRMLLLVPEGSAEELPGLLEWLEWNGVELDLVAHSSYTPSPAAHAGACGGAPRRVAQWWVRPPGNGSDTAPTGTDLARLVSVAATECHRLRLARAARPGGPDTRNQTPQGRLPRDQAAAFSYASRMLAGTRPRSFTS